MFLTEIFYCNIVLYQTESYLPKHIIRFIIEFEHMNNYNYYNLNYLNTIEYSFKVSHLHIIVYIRLINLRIDFQISKFCKVSFNIVVN